MKKIKQALIRSTSELENTTLPYAIYVAVGGGGLISGISIYIKNIWPEVKIIGVEPEDANL